MTSVDFGTATATDAEWKVALKGANATDWTLKLGSDGWNVNGNSQGDAANASTPLNRWRPMRYEVDLERGAIQAVADDGPLRDPGVERAGEHRHHGRVRGDLQLRQRHRLPLGRVRRRRPELPLGSHAPQHDPQLGGLRRPLPRRCVDRAPRLPDRGRQRRGHLQRRLRHGPDLRPPGHGHADGRRLRQQHRQRLGLHQRRRVRGPVHLADGHGPGRGPGRPGLRLALLDQRRPGQDRRGAGCRRRRLRRRPDDGEHLHGGLRRHRRPQGLHRSRRAGLHLRLPLPGQRHRVEHVQRRVQPAPRRP